jgi:hypothetical protein
MDYNLEKYKEHCEVKIYKPYNHVNNDILDNQKDKY